jgi:hypothetical protein
MATASVTRPRRTRGGTPIKLKTKPDPSQHYTCNKFGTHSPTAATRKYNNKPKKKREKGGSAVEPQLSNIGGLISL